MRHHPSEATLVAYAGGALPHAMGLAVAAHLVGCPACRDVKATAEQLGGSALEDLPVTAMSDDALALVLARAERPAPPPVVLPRDPELPAPLDVCKFGTWRRIGFGLRWRPLLGETGMLAGLLEGMPGKALPVHTHAGLELTYILKGSFVDGMERYAAGDVAEMEGDHRHQPRIDGDIPCVCFIATDGFRLRGLFGVAQRLIAG